MRPLALLLLAALPLAAQDPAAAVARERAEFATWLASDPLSPYAALGLQPIGPGISIGAEPSDLPLAGVARGILTEEGAAAVLTTAGERRVLPRGRAVTLGPAARLVVTGAAGRGVAASFGTVRRAKPPQFFGYAAEFRLAVRLEPAERRGRFRVLGLDGAETDANEAGLVSVTVGGATTRLRVYRLGAADDDEAPLYIYFRDATNGRESYPAGRFVELVPARDGGYDLDFNRSRNPYCAYSSVFPCPAPWPGNRLTAAVRAGEQYHAP